MGSIYALIRVSTQEQNEARQVITMTGLGIEKNNIIIEKESGRSTDRKKYRGLVRRLQVGDTLYIENIDRLSRDYDGILEQWRVLTTQKGVILKVLDTPMLNTDQKHDSLTDKFMRDILLRTQAFAAEYEWQKIKNRQAQGIAAAKASGKALGRPKSITTAEKICVVEQYQSHKITIETALSILKLKKSAFYKLCQTVNNINSL